MINHDLAYLFFLTVAISLSYFPIRYLLHYFFKNSRPPALTINWLISCLIILVVSLLVYLINYSIEDVELGNRIIHAFGGGFLAYLVCFLAAKDSQLSVDNLKFFIFAFMLVMTLGIVNEVAEYFLQNHLNFTAAPTINDTWQDLMSNIAGALIAGLCFTPFIKEKKSSKP
jgi:hypothetical protein